MSELFDYFSRKFEENLPKTKSLKEAFEKTNEDIGFQAYSSYKSYSVNRSKKKKGRH
jgi:hypothetical protein